MNICFYSNRMYFEGDWLYKRGMGGSESALVNLTETWKKYHAEDNITVYNGFERPHTTYNGIIYKSHLDFKNECKTFDMDVLITQRNHEPLLEPFIKTKKILFWSQDDMNEGSLKLIEKSPYMQRRIDSFLVISEHSKNDLGKHFRNPFLLLRNGYRDDWVDLNKGQRLPIAIYTSTPYRGLNVLAEVWPEILRRCRERNVEPKLKVISSMSLYQWSDKDFQPLFKYLDSLESVERKEAAPQRQLYDHLKYSSVMLYPNHFLETGCMAVLEALANNNWVVTSNLGALPEQVKDGLNGFIVNGDANTSTYKEEFINKAVESLCSLPIPKNDGLIFSWKEQMEKLHNYIYNLLRKE